MRSARRSPKPSRPLPPSLLASRGTDPVSCARAATPMSSSSTTGSRSEPSSSVGRSSSALAEIVLEEVTKTFGGDVVAVDDVSLRIEDGEFLVLVGPSGCGKSTLLRLIAGLEEATEGRLWIGDRDVTDRAPRERDVAMVFQSYALYPHMTVRQNLGYGL